MVASSDAANPRVPVPKSRVVSLSPTFAGRDLMLWRLKSHIWELSYWEKPLSQFKVYAFPFPNAPTKIRAEIRAAAGACPLCANSGHTGVRNPYSSKPDYDTA